MARPKSIDAAEVLRTARELFLERGMALSVAEIAKACGVAEGSLFNLFGSKAGLLSAAMQVERPIWVLKLPERVGRGTVEAELRELFAEMLEFLRRIVPLAMMSWSEPALREKMREAREDAGPLRAQADLREYLRSEMGLGRIPSQDADSLAMIISGALWNYVSMEMMFIPTSSQLPTVERYLQSLAHLVARGA